MSYATVFYYRSAGVNPITGNGENYMKIKLESLLFIRIKIIHFPKYTLDEYACVSSRNNASSNNLK